MHGAGLSYQQIRDSGPSARAQDQMHVALNLHRRQHNRLMIVAHQARVGVFEGLQAFQAAGKQAVRLPVNVQSSQGRSQSVLSAVLDEIDCWCYSIAAALER